MHPQALAAIRFVRLVQSSIPSAILSLGWTTLGEGLSYSAEMVDEMIQVVAAAGSSDINVTFAVRGSYVRESWPQLRRLLACSFRASLTVWSNVVLAPSEVGWLRENLPRQTMFDLAS